MSKPINRLKVLLAERQKSNKWVAEQLGISQATVSKWCTNTSHPDLETFLRLAKLLDAELNEMVRMEEIKI